jgi:hypothetical protein
MTVADKLCVEQRRTPRMPEPPRRRAAGAHDPSRLRGGGNGRGCNAQQKPGDPCPLRSEAQLAACDEIELAGLAPDFQHHGANRIAGECVGSGAQCVLDIGRPHRHQAARIEPELGEPAHRQQPHLALGKILPHPDQRPPRRHAPRQSCDKAGGRGTLPAALAKHLMQRAACKPALQHRIGLPMAERNALRQSGAALRLDAFDTAAQARKRAHACACHGVASFTRGVAAGRCSFKRTDLREPGAGLFVHDMF